MSFFTCLRQFLVVSSLIGSTFRICSAQSDKLPAHASSPGPRGRFLYAATSDLHAILEFKIGSNGALTGPDYFTLPGSFPQMVVADRTGTFLFAIQSQGILAFTINPNDGALTLVPGSPFPCCSYGHYPTAIGIDPNGEFVYITTDDNGFQTLRSYRVDRSTGALSPISATGSYFASEPKPSSIQTDPLGKFVYLVDPGTGLIAGYPVDLNNGQLGRALFPTPFAAGLGATLISTSTDFLYVFARNQVPDLVGYRLDQGTGRLWPLPGSFSMSHLSWANYMTVDPVHNVLYQPSFGPSTGSIGVYRLKRDGTVHFQNLTAVGQVIAAETVLVDESAAFLFAVGASANVERASPVVTSFRIDPVTGDLEFAGRSATFGSLNYYSSLTVAP